MSKKELSLILDGLQITLIFEIIQYLWNRIPMTSNKPLKVTLLGVKQSKPGNKFIFNGEVNECKDCRLRGACLKLEHDRMYEVLKVRETVHSCNVFEGGVCTVEIFEPSYLVTTGAKLAVEGANITFTQRDCNIIECPHYSHHCCPTYLNDGEKLKIIKISDESIDCKQEYQLKLITVDRINSNDK